MRIRTNVAVAVAAVLAAPAVTAAPAADAGARMRAAPVTLGRVNVIEGSEPAMARVRIPEEATFDLRVRPYREEGPNRSVRIEGRGRVVGVALVPPAPVEGGLVDSGRALFSGRYSECAGAGCDPAGKVVNFQQPSVLGRGEGPASGRLAPGDYRLVLIADGEPVRVELVLRGLEGRRRIVPAAPAPVDLKTPAVHVSHLGGPSYFSAGDTFEGGSRGVAFSLLTVRGPVDPVDAAYGMCGFYRSAAQPPDPALYGPQCHALPGAMAVGTWKDAGRFDVFFLQDYGDTGVPPTDLTRGHGVWFASRSPVTAVTAHVFTLVLD